MPIKLDYEEARAAIGAALARSSESAALPIEWISYARTVFAFQSKTYPTALATLLLAKSLNDEVDTLSIKAQGERSYSIRGLGHSVVVPAAVTHGFSLRVTGREPLNNQPWFRYNRIDEFERVRVRKDYEFFLEVARRANGLTSGQAALALSAFLRVALEEAAKVKAVAVKVTGLSAEGVRIAAEDFLRRDAVDRPQRLQAFAAACIGVSHSDVRSRRINDPSRDLPGDVHAYREGVPILALEVRGKPVPATEFASFADSCATAGIGRAMLFVDTQQHKQIDLDELDSHALSSGAVQAIIFESVAQLIETTIGWADAPVAATTKRLAEAVLDQLRDIEVARATLEEWVRALSVVQAR